MSQKLIRHSREEQGEASVELGRYYATDPPATSLDSVTTIRLSLHFDISISQLQYLCYEFFSGDLLKAGCTILHNNVVQFFKAGCIILRTRAGSRKEDIDNGQTAHILVQPVRRQDCFPNSSEFKPSL